MKKNLKKIIICFALIIVCYILFIGIETIRFNNYIGSYPLIKAKEIDVDIIVNNNKKKETIKGIGYTFEYEYITGKQDGKNIKKDTIISGKMKLFNKFLLSAWIS